MDRAACGYSSIGSARGAHCEFLRLSHYVDLMRLKNGWSFFKIMKKNIL